MGNSDKASPLYRYSVFLLFALLALISLAWFSWNMLQTVTQIGSNASVISFDKGAVYLLGVGMGLSLLTYGILHEVILWRPLTKTFTKRFNVGAMTSILVMFILPHIVHFSIENVLEDRNYIICDQASYQWRMFRTIVYVSIEEECEILVEEKK